MHYIQIFVNAVLMNKSKIVKMKKKKKEQNTKNKTKQKTHTNKIHKI